MRRDQKLTPAIPLRVLVCDAEASSADILTAALRRRSVEVKTSRTTIQAAETLAREDDVNTVFIDPLSLGIEEASAFVFRLRRTLPEIVFVLYLDRARAERERDTFFQGERSRFAHYYSLDKATSIGAFDDELEAVLKLCQDDLSWRMSSGNIDRLLSRTALLEGGPQSANLAALKESLERLAGC